MTSLTALLEEIRGCRECAAQLPLGPRPIVAASPRSRVLIIGQAPGLRVHESGVPWDDPSGERLRDWLGLSPQDFYDTAKIAIVPMGFCYPGSGASGDLPPREECAPLWHARLLKQLKQIQLTLLIGRYAQEYVLQERRKRTLTETVASWREFTPTHLPLPHPSPRNNRWLKKNEWFESEVIPYLRRRVREVLKERK